MSYQQFELNQYPVTTPEKEIWSLTKIELPNLKENEFLIQLLYVSVDPYMRGMMRNQGFSLNKLIPARGVGKVVESKNENYKIGEYYSGMMSLSEFYVGSPKDFLLKADDRIPLNHYLSIFGMTGATAYQGVIESLETKKGDVFVVNAASGAVGLVAGRIAKLLGAYVVGVRINLNKKGNK
jgi:NADPH:quinone reductase